MSVFLDQIRQLRLVDGPQRVAIPGQLTSITSEASARDAIDVLDVIVAEFESDPMSVQCFDLRVVERAKAIVGERRRRQREIESWLGPGPRRRIR